MKTAILNTDKLCNDFNKLLVELTLLNRETDTKKYDAYDTLFISVTHNGDLVSKDKEEGLLYNSRPTVQSVKRFREFIIPILLDLGYDASYADNDSVATLLRSLLLDAVQRDIAFKQNVLENVLELDMREKEPYLDLHRLGPKGTVALYKELIADTNIDILVSFDMYNDTKTENNDSLYINILNRHTHEVTKVSVKQLWDLTKDWTIPASIFSQLHKEAAERISKNVLPHALRAFCLSEMTQYRKVLQLLRANSPLPVFNPQIHCNIARLHSLPELKTQQPNPIPDPKFDIQIENNIFGSITKDFNVGFVIAGGIDLVLTAKAEHTFLSNLTISFGDIQQDNIDLMLFTQNYFIYLQLKDRLEDKGKDPYFCIFDKIVHTQAMMQTLKGVLKGSLDIINARLA